SAKQDIKPIDPQEYLKQMKEKLKKKKEPPITSVISDEKEITTGMQSAGIEQQKNIEIQLPAAPQQVKIQTTIAPSDITQPILKPTIYLHATDETKKFNRPLI
ncbi:MAG: hypothetical protein N2114_04295, partial [Candidatus Goldbacteria bacterium]|nr:hypothetical protein [Candidatus Goldiibacteriota bacterium]